MNSDQVTANTNCIIDADLPDFVDFNYLKQTGIQQLQKMVGDVWSNYNDSDPGVTILDQLCYALTELGYCAQFPIEDVLTLMDGRIDYKDQFFEPQDVLTTSPVTINDYRRLVHDNVKEVRVVYIVPEQCLATSQSTDAATAATNSSQQQRLTGRYQTFVAPQKEVEDGAVNALLLRTYVLLNQNRNLAELFLPPLALIEQKVTLLGSVVLLGSADATQVYNQILESLLNFSAPLPVRSGYDELIQQGYTTDQIVDGPKMQHGWICGEQALGEKRTSIGLYQIYSLIAAVPGVAYVESVNFTADSISGSDDPVNIVVATNAIAVLDFDPSFTFIQHGDVVVIQPSKADANSEQFLGALNSAHQASSINAKVDIYPVLPHGNYRDIEHYYSVQMTFPDQFNIGRNSPQPDASENSVANSRQLQGYLMPFDQLLANEFAQLAHVSELFSFIPKKFNLPQTVKMKGANGPINSPVNVPVNVQGIPYKNFSTTYFCQPLYQIPNVKPLLVGHDAFRYQFSGLENDKLIETAEWKAYKEFPFNQYRSGLLQSIEDNDEADKRRNTMLNHLMARHGDDGKIYDTMTGVSQWAGSEVKAALLVKSIWLQNFQKLSYYRARAFDFVAASPLSKPGLAASGSNQKASFSTYDHQHEWVDGEIDQTSIYAKARIEKPELDKFSTFELKMGILFGLPRYFLNLASKLQLLVNDADFCTWISSTSTSSPEFKLPDSDISVKRGVQDPTNSQQKYDQVFEGPQWLINVAWSTSQPPQSTDYLAYAQQLSWLATERQGALLIEPILLLPEAPISATFSAYFLTAFLCIPSYVNLLQQAKFQQALSLLQSLHWPSHVNLQNRPSSFDSLKSLISNYVRWNNSSPAPGKANPFSVKLAALLQLPAIQS